MFASSRIRALFVPALALVALAIALPGCEEDTKPKITKFTATPECDVVKVVTEVVYDPTDSSIIAIDTLGTWLDVRFFARATSGNELSDPTGANSPLEWSWNFGDGATSTNTVGPTHRYFARGEYTVTLTVKDDDGDEDTATMQILVGEAYTDLDILHIEAEAVPELTFTVVPGSTTVAQDRIFASQLALDDMIMSFNGILLSSCRVSGLFEQYLWEWSLTNTGTGQVTELVDRNPATIPMNPGYIQMDADLSVTESVTGINRQAAASTLNPVGAKVSGAADQWVVPNTTTTLKLEGYLLQGVQEMTFELEWPDSVASLEDVTFDAAISAGFTATSTSPASNRLAISLTNPSGYSGSETISPIADVRFALNQVAAAPYAVRIRSPYAMRDGDPAEGAPFTTADGGFRLDTDCNGDLRSDSFDLATNPGLFDCNGNGVHDSCDILNGTSPDENDNGIPDECETPRSGN